MLGLDSRFDDTERRRNEQSSLFDDKINAV